MRNASQTDSGDYQSGARETNGSPIFPYDAIDRHIIQLLQQDGRLSNTVIAQSVGLSEASIRRRINRLLETETIKVVAVPSPKTAGLNLSAIIGITCDLKQLDEVANIIASYPETRYLGYSTGSFDLMLEAFFCSHQHLLDFMKEKLAVIEAVRDTETAIILKVAKFSFEWELPLEH